MAYQLKHTGKVKTYETLTVFQYKINAQESNPNRRVLISANQGVTNMTKEKTTEARKSLTSRFSAGDGPFYGWHENLTAVSVSVIKIGRLLRDPVDVAEDSCVDPRFVSLSAPLPPAGDACREKWQLHYSWRWPGYRWRRPSREMKTALQLEMARLQLETAK